MAGIDKVYDALNEYAKGMETKLANLKTENAELREVLLNTAGRLDTITHHDGKVTTDAEWRAAVTTVESAVALLNRLGG